MAKNIKADETGKKMVGMRLSIDTLLFLARAGDKQAKLTVLWLCGALPGEQRAWWRRQRLDAEAWSMNGGHIGAGWRGLGARHWPIHVGGYR